MDYDCPYTTDLTLLDDAIFYRFIPSMMVSWEDGNPTIQSRAFGEIGKDRAATLGYPEPATSIAFHDEIIASGKTVEEVADLELNQNCGIAKLTVGSVRAIPLGIGILKDGKTHNPWHGILFATTRRQLKREKSALVAAVQEIVRLPSRP